MSEGDIWNLRNSFWLDQRDYGYFILSLRQSMDVFFFFIDACVPLSPTIPLSLSPLPNNCIVNPVFKKISLLWSPILCSVDDLVFTK